jgi:hypothetical protein
VVPPTFDYEQCCSSGSNECCGSALHQPHLLSEGTSDDRGPVQLIASEDSRIRTTTPAFYADDDVLSDSVRIHSHVAIDHLTGQPDKDAHVVGRATETASESKRTLAWASVAE